MGNGVVPGRRNGMRVGYLLLACGLSIAVAGCGTPPTTDVDAARASVENATANGASQYASASLKEAQDAQAALDAEMKAQDGKWFRSYDKAKELAATAKAAGDKASTEAATAKEKATAKAAAAKKHGWRRRLLRCESAGRSVRR